MSETNGYSEHFQQRLLDSVLKQIVDGVRMDYHSSVKVPEGWLKTAFDRVDFDAVMDLVRPNLEQKIAEQIANSLMQEVGTDVKRWMSIRENRERLRYVVYPKILDVVGGESSTPTPAETGGEA